MTETMDCEPHPTGQDPGPHGQPTSNKNGTHGCSSRLGPADPQPPLQTLLVITAHQTLSRGLCLLLPQLVSVAAKPAPVRVLLTTDPSYAESYADKTSSSAFLSTSFFLRSFSSSSSFLSS